MDLSRGEAFASRHNRVVQDEQRLPSRRPGIRHGLIRLTVSQAETKPSVKGLDANMQIARSNLSSILGGGSELTA